VQRFETDRTFTMMGIAGETHFTVGSRWPVEDEGVAGMILASGRPARKEDTAGMPGALGAAIRDDGMVARVGVPIIVEGGTWGFMVAATRPGKPIPPDVESRLNRFTELLATAIANTDSRVALAASRARIIAASDDARRRVVRDLHDGAQQRLVHSIITLKLALRALREKDGEAKSLLDEALEQTEQANVELRELAHGILPSVLTRGGLQAGVETVVSRLDLPVDVDIAHDRLPAEIEASAYFIIAEALTNVVKHAHATRAEVHSCVEKGTLLVEVRDDGVGGADPAGHGLIGLADRTTALGGRLQVQGLAVGGTLVSAALPLPAPDGAEPFRRSAGPTARAPRP
jgi:signal transduction histidine kinase